MSYVIETLFSEIGRLVPSVVWLILWLLLVKSMSPDVNKKDFWIIAISSVVIDRIGHPRVALFIATLILIMEAYTALSTLKQKKEE